MNDTRNVVIGWSWASFDAGCSLLLYCLVGVVSIQSGVVK